MLKNSIRALRLETDFYNTVERDSSYTFQAALVVVIVSIISAVGSGLGSDSFVRGLIGTSISGLVSWFIWAGVTTVVGRSLFGGTTDVGEMLRVLGFAQVPRVIGVFSFIWLIGWIILLIGWVWTLVAAVVAVREGQDFSTSKALGTLIVGFIPVVFIEFVLRLIF